MLDQWHRHSLKYRSQCERLVRQTQADETDSQRKDQQIKNLLPLRDQLIEANRQAETWQRETGRSQSAQESTRGTNVATESDARRCD